MSEPTLKQFLHALIDILNEGTEQPICPRDLNILVQDAYAIANAVAAERRRLLTKHSEKGDVR